MGFFRNGPVKRFVLFPMPRIDSIIADHFEMFFRDMLDESLNEFKSGDFFYHKFVVFMPVVMESDSIPIIVVNAGSGNNRPSEVTANIVGNNMRIREVGFCVNIKTFGAMLVDKRFHLFEGRTKPLMKFIEQSGAEGITEESIIEMGYFTPEAIITDPTFGNQTVNMGVPLERTAKGMEDTDEAGGKVFGFVHLVEHAQEDAADSRKKTIEKGAVLEEKGT